MTTIHAEAAVLLRRLLAEVSAGRIGIGGSTAMLRRIQGAAIALEASEPMKDTTKPNLAGEAVAAYTLSRQKSSEFTRAGHARDAAAYALSQAGWSVRRIGKELGVSHALAHRMVKAHRERVAVEEVTL